MKCSIFTGFSRHKEDLDILEILKVIKSEKHLGIVMKIRSFTALGKNEEAARVKKQLQAATLSATYSERRVPEKITGYNDVIMLDFDKLSPDELSALKTKITESGHTLFCFVSPSGNGLKAGVRLATDAAERLRKRVLSVEQIAFTDLEMYHKEMFELTRIYYETLCGVEVDISGSDIGRLFFYSYDPELFVDETAIRNLPLPTCRVIPAEPEKKTGKRLIRKEMPGNAAVDCSKIEAAVQMLFQQCVRSVERTLNYEQGQRDIFLYTLGNKCYQKELPEAAVVALAEKFYGAPDMDVRTPIASGYRYTSKTDKYKKEKKKPIAQRIAEFADEHYEIRRNTIMKRVEFREKGSDKPFEPMELHHYNTIFYDLDMAGIRCTPSTVKSVIDSRYAREYHPFRDYFYNLPPWDGVTDYIGQLADTIQTTNQVFWRDCFKRWLTGLVACALDDYVTNQLALIIKGAQGKGKSTWIRSLLPPELRLHYRNGMLHPKDRDHALVLTICLIINLEEFEGMKNGEIAELKRIITQESVLERKAYEKNHDLYIRRASIIASTNEPRFLQDITGTRRFPTVTALEINYKEPVNHPKVYAQALHLWKTGFHFWYQDDEISMLNNQNLEYSLSIPEEELFYIYFCKPAPNSLSVKWMPVSAILTHLNIYGKIQINGHSIRTLTKILERDGFEKVRSLQNVYEYAVIQIPADEVEMNFKVKR